MNVTYGFVSACDPDPLVLDGAGLRAANKTHFWLADIAKHKLDIR